MHVPRVSLQFPVKFSYSYIVGRNPNPTWCMVRSEAGDLYFWMAQSKAMVNLHSIDRTNEKMSAEIFVVMPSPQIHSEIISASSQGSTAT